MSGEKVRRFRQFYVEFIDPLEIVREDEEPRVTRLAAIAVNTLTGKGVLIELIEFRSKVRAKEFRILAGNVEVKVGVNIADKAWIHVSVPAGEAGLNPQELATEILEDYLCDRGEGECSE